MVECKGIFPSIWVNLIECLHCLSIKHLFPCCIVNFWSVVLMTLLVQTQNRNYRKEKNLLQT